MKDRYPKALQSLRNRGQHGDYMLQSRTASDLGEKEPMTIEYDDNYQNHQNKPSVEEPEILANAEDYKEELMLIESGNFVLTAPSLATQGMRNFEEQREEPPPPDLGGLGRNRTESFEADFTGIEKTYTTFVNVAEDQIYPLELKFFLEAALEEGVESLPRKKSSKNISSRRTMVTNHSVAATNGLQSTSTNATKSSKSPQSITPKVEEKDSDSVNSESKKFRLFPNLRDVATRRTRRIEAVRQRLIEGRKRDKKDKSDRTKEDQKEVPTFSNAALSSEFKPVPREEQLMPSLPTVTTLKTIDSKAAMVVPVIENARATSPIDTGVTLQELAEKILGKEIPKSEVSVYDFTKSKRKKKKKNKENVLNGSTSFPVLSSPDMSWDSPRSMLASQDDGVVKYDTNSGASKNDNCDTVTVARGVEAVYSGTDDGMQGLFVTVEKSKEASTDAPRLSTAKSQLSETESKLYNDKSPSGFALSRSFDDVYHSSIVQSIKNEIVTAQPLVDNTPQTDFSLAATSDPAMQQDFKWFNFGRQQKQQPMPTYPKLETSVQAQPDTTDERDDAPSVTEARDAFDMASPTSNNEVVDHANVLTKSENTNGVLESSQEQFDCASKKKNSANGKIDKSSSPKKLKKGKARRKKSSGQDDFHIPDECESFNSVRLENDDDNVSVITERSEKVVSNFVSSFGKLLLLFGRKVNSVITCSPMEINGTGIIEDLTFHDEDLDEESVVVVNENEAMSPECVHIDNKVDESMSSPKDMEVIVGETVIDDVPAPKRVATVTSFPSKNSSLSMVSRVSSKTYDSDDSETIDSDDEDNITRTSSATSEWDEGAKTHWCSCAR